LWLGVKGLSNLDIAGSPRNIFKYSIEDVLRCSEAAQRRG